MALPPLMDTSLTLDFICKAFASQVDWQVEPVFSHSFHTDDMPIQKGVIQAAVFFPLVQRPSGLHGLFTRRASHLYDHAGQISFPGGRLEIGRASCRERVCSYVKVWAVPAQLKKKKSK